MLAAGYVACHTAMLLVSVLTQCRHGNAGFSLSVLCVGAWFLLSINQSVIKSKQTHK